MAVPRRLIRYSAAFILLIYGFAKINGAQFTILDSELDKPMGHVTGFWLTWYYFGFSQVYGTFIALVEIVGAMLLTFRRTAFLGACILAPLMANIVLIDVFYGVEAGATLVAFLLLVAMLVIIAPETPKLVALFWSPKSSTSNSTALALSRWTARVTMLAIAIPYTYWVANYNNREPTPIDGAWDVVRVEPVNLTESLPATIYFEHNRAHMAVFRTGEVYNTHHFEVDRTAHRIRIFQAWLGKGAEIFDGAWKLASPQLELHGNWQNVGDVTLTMHQRKVRE
jgi:hypothetical protein